MGKINYGKTTFYSGRVCNVVAYTWRGRQCLRSMPTHYTDRQSDAQLQQRAMFKAVNAFAARARKVLKVGLKVASLNAQMTEANYFMRINKGCFALPAGAQASSLQSNAGPQASSLQNSSSLQSNSGTQAPRLRNNNTQPDATASGAPAYQTSLSIDYESLVLAEGPVAPVAFEAPRLLDEVTVHIDFEQNPLRRTVKPDDLVYLVAYCPELGDFDLSAPSYRRYNFVEMRLNPYWIGREVHLWGFVVDAAGRASMSQYLGSGIVGEMGDDVDADEGESPFDSQANKSASDNYSSHKSDVAAPSAAPKAVSFEADDG